MTEQQQIEHALQKPSPRQDSDPVWKRLLKSIRVTAKPKGSVKKPAVKIEIKGGFEF